MGLYRGPEEFEVRGRYDCGGVGKDSSRELTNAGLWPDVDERKSQFLEFPDGLFAEIVLNDGSKLAEAERVVSLLKVESKLDRQELDAIVRANWTIEGVDGPVPAIVVPGGIRSAWAFTATLKAGGLSKTVVVHVTMSLLML